jgi:hypothetical protein
MDTMPSHKRKRGASLERANFTGMRAQSSALSSLQRSAVFVEPPIVYVTPVGNHTGLRRIRRPLPTLAGKTGVTSAPVTRLFASKARLFGYSPINLTIYTAAYSGVISGLSASGRILLDTDDDDYAAFTTIAGTFAESLDIAWAAGPATNPPNTLQVFEIEKTCKGVWESRSPELNTATLDTSSFAETCNAIVALVEASSSYFASQGITPAAWPSGSGSGSVTVVTAGTGISITGTPTVDPQVNNTGVLGITAGLNCTVTGTAQNPIINSTGGGSGVAAVDAGTGITVTGSPSVPVVNNAGVTSNIAGTGIGVSGATGAVTITNNGVLSVSGGTNVTVTGTAANPIVNTAAEVASITAGTGIAVTGTASVPIVSNTGVLSVSAGTNVTVTGTAANPVVNATVPIGSSQIMRFAITNAATQNSVNSIPNGAIVLRTFIDVHVAYSPGATATVGNASVANQLMDTPDSDLTTVNIYEVAQDTVFSGPNTVLVTIGGAPSTGSGFVIVEFVASPLN